MDEDITQNEIEELMIELERLRMLKAIDAASDRQLERLKELEAEARELGL